MVIRRKFLLSSLTALAAVSACQSNTTGEAPATAGASAAGAGAAGASGNRPMGGASGHAVAGQSSVAGSAVTGGAAHAGDAGDAGDAGEVGDIGGSGIGGANAGSGGGANAGSGGTSGAGGSVGSGGAKGGSANGGEAGADNGEAGSSGQIQREFAYFSGLFKGVTICELDLTSGPTGGTPHVLPSSPIGSKQAIALAVDPAQRLLYLATQGGHLDSYRIAADGSLPATPTSSIQTPNGVPAIEPKGRFLYGVGTGIQSYKIDAASGALSAIGEAIAVGSSSPEYVAADPTGNFVYVSQSGEQGLRGYRIDQTSGALDELTGSPFGAAGLPVGDSLLGGAIVFKPSGDFLYTTGAGPNAGALNAFAIEAGTGKLSLVTGSPFSLDLGSDLNASNIAMDPQGQYLYVTSAFLTRHVSGFAIAADGTLKPVPGPVLTTASPYSVGVDPSGRFVYIGDDSGNNAVYALTRANGKLVEIMSSPFLFGGLQPEVAFAVVP